MESNIYSSELAEMREQIQLLKSKLDNEKIINDRMLRKAMNKSVNKIRNAGRISITFGIITIICCPTILYLIQLPLWFIVITAIMLMFSTSATWIIHSGIKSELLYDKDMIQVAQKVHTLKKQYNNWLYIAIPMILGYIAAFIYCILESELIPKEAHAPMIAGIAIGGIIGGIIGAIRHIRILQTTDELLEQINEITQ